MYTCDPILSIPRPKILMILFMIGILSMYPVIHSILHLSVPKFQGFPRIITSISLISILVSRQRPFIIRQSHQFASNFPFSFSVHPSQERPWANTGSQGFSRLIHWGYVHLLLIQGYDFYSVMSWRRRYDCSTRCILETKTKVGSTEAKTPDPRINPLWSEN